MSWLIPRNNPYWHRNISKAIEIERREELLKIVRPSEKDWLLLQISSSVAEEPLKPTPHNSKEGK